MASSMTTIERLTKTGIRRLGTPRSGFRYVLTNGRKAGAKDLFRIHHLKVPPAWKAVAIHPSPAGAVQAVGRDAAGRWQYRYHPSRVARREAEKSRRLVHFAEALPDLRRRIARDIARPGLPRERVMAVILEILSACFLRPGSQVYADENGSFGIATLRRGHVSVRGDTVRFDFPGKSGKRQERVLRHRRVARVVRELLSLPGREVFKFEGAGKRLVDIRRRDINEYIKQVMGERFSAKDFRTWAGTLICACALARSGGKAGESKAGRRRMLVAAIREAADQLGNTVAVCRSSYIHPRVLAGFEKGRVIDRYFDTVEGLLARRGRGLHESEKALLRLLKEKTA